MEENEDVQDIIVNVDMNGVISELQSIKVLTETLKENYVEMRTEVENGFLVCGMFLMVASVISIRNMILSWTKRGVKNV